MTDLDAVLARAADNLSRDVTPPPPAPVLARARRRHRLRVTLPAAVVPAAAAVAVALVAAGPSLVLPGRHDGRRTVYATDGPELGRIPLPADVPSGTRIGGPNDPPQQRPADLLAVGTTKNGRARLIGYRLRSGARCVYQDYAVPFLNSTGATACSFDGHEPYSRQPLTVGGSADGTPGAIKSAPLAYGAAPPGTRTVEFTAAGRAPLRVPARDGGPSYGHRAFFITTWPFGIASTVRAFDAAGRETARTAIAGQGADSVAVRCEGAASVLLSHLQSASLLGTKWARTHPGSGDPERLLVPNGRRIGPGRSVADSATATARFRLAIAEAADLGPEEKYEYRMAAVVVLGDGGPCFDQALADTARQLLADTAAG
jgi:hypothetical protein